MIRSVDSIVGGGEVFSPARVSAEHANNAIPSTRKNLFISIPPCFLIQLVYHILGHNIGEDSRPPNDVLSEDQQGKRNQDEYIRDRN
jgi:hypothetical protein